MAKKVRISATDSIFCYCIVINQIFAQPLLRRSAKQATAYGSTQNPSSLIYLCLPECASTSYCIFSHSIYFVTPTRSNTQCINAEVSQGSVLLGLEFQLQRLELQQRLGQQRFGGGGEEESCRHQEGGKKR